MRNHFEGKIVTAARLNVGAIPVEYSISPVKILQKGEPSMNEKVIHLKKGWHPALIEHFFPYEEKCKIIFSVDMEGYAVQFSKDFLFEDEKAMAQLYKLCTLLNAVDENGCFDPEKILYEKISVKLVDHDNCFSIVDFKKCIIFFVDPYV